MDFLEILVLLFSILEAAFQHIVKVLEREICVVMTLFDSVLNWFKDPRTILSIIAICLSIFNYLQYKKFRNQDNDKSLMDSFWFQKVVAEPYTEVFEDFFTAWRHKGSSLSFDAEAFITALRKVTDRSLALRLFDESFLTVFDQMFDTFDNTIDEDYDKAFDDLNRAFYSNLLQFHRRVNDQVMRDKLSKSKN